MHGDKVTNNVVFHSCVRVGLSRQTDTFRGKERSRSEHCDCSLGWNYIALIELLLSENHIKAFSFRVSLWHKGIEQRQLFLPGTSPRTKVRTQERPSQLEGLQKGRGMRGQAEQLKQRRRHGPSREGEFWGLREAANSKPRSYKPFFGSSEAQKIRF